MPEETSQLRIDVKTLRPTPRAIVSYKGKEYEVLSLLDIPYDNMMDILGAAQAPAPEGQLPVVTNINRTRGQLLALVPSLGAELVNTMSYHEMEAFLHAALGAGENPQQGDPNPS